jgi:hypothetical protein
MDTTLKTFHTICSFVKELKELFGKEHHNIVLYHRFLEKTPITNTLAINKQIAIFSEFLRKNVKCLLEKTTDGMWDKIIFSKKIYINIKEVMESTDVETRDTIWKYLLSIHFYVFQTDDVRAKLSELLSSKPGDNGAELEFIEDFMSAIEEKFKEKEFTDPMSATQELLTSGLFNNMVATMDKGIKEKRIDIGKLLGAVQGMVGNISKDVDETKTPNGQSMPDISTMFNMVNGMMSTMGMGGVNTGGSALDLGGLMGMLQQSQSQLQQSSETTIEEVKDEDQSNIHDVE